jgi:hypothetical protein
MAPKGELRPTMIEVSCTCGRVVNIRTNEPTHWINCWSCNRKITVHLYPGQEKVSVFMAEPDGTAEHQLHSHQFRIVYQK